MTLDTDAEAIKKPVSENECTRKIAQALHSILLSRGFSIEVEPQMHDNKRVDSAVTSTTPGKQLMVPIEAKGQWHKDLFTAPKDQLNRSYSKHPTANGNGIYLVYWFGKEYPVANRKRHEFISADKLQDRLESRLSADGLTSISVVVLDLSAVRPPDCRNSIT